MYMNENRGAYPRTRASAGPNRIPTWGTGVAATQPFADDGPAENDVSAAIFLLIRTQDITSEVFNCPSSNAEKDMYGGQSSSMQRSNFTSIKTNLSYSYQNLYADNATVAKDYRHYGSARVEFAIAADINPGTAGGDDVLGVTMTSSAGEMKLGNSNNHQKAGQNVLYGDGHVAWTTNAFCGVNRDNIYTTGDGRVSGSSVNLFEDSILLPTDD